MTHTPQPWNSVIEYRHPDGLGNNYQVGVISSCGDIIAEIPQFKNRRSLREDQKANAKLIAAAPDMYDLIATFGDSIADMFEQLTRGNWVDDLGHDVRLNAQMLALQGRLKAAIDLRAKIAGMSTEEWIAGGGTGVSK